MSANTGIVVGVRAAQVAVRVVGASAAATDAAAIIVATGGAAAVVLVAFGIFKMITRD